MGLIDAKIVLNRYQEICKGTACLDCPFNNEGCAFEKLILESAIVDAEPVRHGKWIEDGIDKWRCSVCQKGDVYAFSWSISEGYELQDNYCPHCGAKMDLEEVKDNEIPV